MQVYLPDDLYALVKKHCLPASELLQNAVRAEARRLDLLAETERYTKAVASAIGQPGTKEQARARSIAQRISRRGARKAS